MLHPSIQQRLRIRWTAPPCWIIVIITARSISAISAWTSKTKTKTKTNTETETETEAETETKTNTKTNTNPPSSQRSSVLGAKPHCFHLHPR